MLHHNPHVALAMQKHEQKYKIDKSTEVHAVARVFFGRYSYISKQGNASVLLENHELMERKGTASDMREGGLTSSCSRVTDLNSFCN